MIGIHYLNNIYPAILSLRVKRNEHTPNIKQENEDLSVKLRKILVGSMSMFN